MLTNVRRLMGCPWRRSSWLFMEVFLCVKLELATAKNAGNNRHNIVTDRSVRAFRPRLFPQLSSEGRGVLLRGITEW
jgi:hypothetical protein